MKLISFRPDLQDKLEAFLQIMQESRGYSFDRLNLPPDIRNIKETYQDCGGEFWVLEDHNSIIGSIAIRAIDPEKRIGEIKRYFVLPSYQRQGIGGKLMAHAIRFAEEVKFEKIRLDTMKKSESAIIVFKKYGFYEIPKYNNNDVAEIFMERSLNM
ncbi:GNAT family N-acetyltransferase [Deefgea rivuli]|uniref:GNAT family N-acetyltransferase n=1 Tax=Deefgea rivuli TaxID=400948 RepID=UPI0004871349|nr:GNAT family N-acetyltransferase [Deefgea rivuli]